MWTTADGTISNVYEILNKIFPPLVMQIYQNTRFLNLSSEGPLFLDERKGL